MTRHVRIYVEGGSTGHRADIDFRRGWGKFLRELSHLAQQHGFQSLKIVRSGGRSDAFRRFKNYKTQYPNDLSILLVDSETFVDSSVGVWDAVRRRTGDQWVKPEWASESHLYLMVHFVETWLVSDQAALSEFFKKGFNSNFLPTTNLEGRPKREIEMALAKATASCKKGHYRHVHSHEILENVRPEMVKKLYHGQRLFETLSRFIVDQS